MPQFKYQALALDGSKHSGALEAASATQLAGALRESGLYLVAHRAVEEKQQSIKFNARELSDFCRQLGAMLASGITLIRAMQIIAQRDAKPKVKKTYADIVEDLKRGHPLSDALQNRGRTFPPLLVNMIRAGENAGGLDATADKMAETYEKQHKIDSKMRGASIYPIVLLALTVAVVIIMFTFVLPQFTSVFVDMELPLPTQVMMGISWFLINYWVFALGGAVILVAAVMSLFRLRGPRLWLDRLKLRLPVMGKMLRTIYTARFARTLASLYVSGIPMMQSLNIARSTVVNTYIEGQFDHVLRELSNGRTLSQALDEVDGFDQKLCSTILIGEESGRLEQMLDSVADQFDYEAEVSTQKLVSLMEPAMIIVLAVIVGGVIMSVLLPILQMYQETEKL